MAIVSVINKDISVDVTVKDILNYSSVVELAEYINEISKKTDDNKDEHIEIIEKREYYHTSDAQKRLYSIQALHNKNTSYNIPLAVKLEGKLSVITIQEAMDKIIERHELLRASFTINEGELL